VAIQHGLLAILADGPSYGYQIKADFEQAVGPEWGQLNIGHVYQVLERLVRDGFATPRTMSSGSRPDRTVYTITPAGRIELDTWLSEPALRSAGYRDDWILKVTSAARRGEQAVHTVCSVQRAARMADLQALRNLRAQHKDDPGASITIEAAIGHTQADLRLIDTVARQYVTSLATAFAPSQPTEDSAAADEPGERRRGRRATS
jgi:DNA-binding PadR family transcriptional regulator